MHLQGYIYKNYVKLHYKVNVWSKIIIIYNYYVMLHLYNICLNKL